MNLENSSGIIYFSFKINKKQKRVIPRNLSKSCINLPARVNDENDCRIFNIGNECWKLKKKCCMMITIAEQKKEKCCMQIFNIELSTQISILKTKFGESKWKNILKKTWLLNVDNECVMLDMNDWKK